MNGAAVFCVCVAVFARAQPRKPHSSIEEHFLYKHAQDYQWPPPGPSPCPPFPWPSWMWSFQLVQSSTVLSGAHVEEQTFRAPSTHQPQMDFMLHEAQSVLVAQGSTTPAPLASCSVAAHSPSTVTHSLLQTFRPMHQPQPSSLRHWSHGLATQ